MELLRRSAGCCSRRVGDRRVRDVARRPDRARHELVVDVPALRVRRPSSGPSRRPRRSSGRSGPCGAPSWTTAASAAHRASGACRGDAGGEASEHANRKFPSLHGARLPHWYRKRWSEKRYVRHGHPRAHGAVGVGDDHPLHRQPHAVDRRALRAARVGQEVRLARLPPRLGEEAVGARHLGVVDREPLAEDRLVQPRDVLPDLRDAAGRRLARPTRAPCRCARGGRSAGRPAGRRSPRPSRVHATSVAMRCDARDHPARVGGARTIVSELMPPYG